VLAFGTPIVKERTERNTYSDLAYFHAFFEVKGYELIICGWNCATSQPLESRFPENRVDTPMIECRRQPQADRTRDGRNRFIFGFSLRINSKAWVKADEDTGVVIEACPYLDSVDYHFYRLCHYVPPRLGAYYRTHLDARNYLLG
jgi:hypothetical protein